MSVLKTCTTLMFTAVSCLPMLAVKAPFARAEDGLALPQATIDGTGAGWIQLGKTDFADVNCDADTWVWKKGVLHCTGKPIGVLRSQKQYKNFELVIQWRHLSSGGNSGIFVWASEKALHGIKPDELPNGGIEIQMLDHGYARQYEEKHGEEADWFTTHGDVFAVGNSKLDPFPPLSANGNRSFPTKRLSRGTPNWNQYYIRGINGEIRLWVNGEEVSGGSNADPSSGYFALESEGASVEFMNIRVRVLP